MTETNKKALGYGHLGLPVYLIILKFMLRQDM